MSINKQIILGYVGNEPKVTAFTDGCVANFSVATTDKAYTLKNGTQVPEHTEWFNCKATGSIAVLIRDYVHKGSRLYVEGKTFTRSYTAQDGTQKVSREIIVSTIELCDSKPTQQPAQPAQPQPAQPQPAQQTPGTGDDDLPF